MNVFRGSVCLVMVAGLLGQPILAAQDIDHDHVLQLAVDRVKENANALRRLTCEEHTSRSYYVSTSHSISRTTADSLSGLQTDVSPPLPPLLALSYKGLNLLWSDRLRIELSLFNGKDMFSWPGGASFDSELDNLITDGATLSGVLGPFDVSVLMNDADPSLFHFERTLTAFGATVAEYSYKVPAERSHLVVPDASGKRHPVAYDGFFLVDVSTGDLRRLCVELKQFPADTQLFQGAVATDYGTQTIADTMASVPLTSTMRLLFKEGQLAVNNMRYVDCHQFRAESTLHFKPVAEIDEATKSKSISEQLPAIPKNRSVKLALNAPIDSNTAAAGDPVEAHVANTLKGKNGQVVIPAGAIVRGRILRLIHYAPPANSFDLVLKFDRLQAGGGTASIHLSPPEPEPEQPIHNNAITAQRSPVTVIQGQSQLTAPQDDRKNGTGTLHFKYTNHLHLAAGYTTDWIIN